MAAAYPYVHTWDDNGIQRQAQIHMTVTGSEAVWDARHPGDPQPWQNLDYENVRHSDDEIDDQYEPPEDDD
jgi:hypothetical protein